MTTLAWTPGAPTEELAIRVEWHPGNGIRQRTLVTLAVPTVGDAPGVLEVRIDGRIALTIEPKDML